MHTGSCLCGAVSFNVSTELQPPDACHCTTCRKWTGHFFVATDIVTGALDLSGADKVTWYQSSQKVQRGFCSVCGRTLFFDPLFMIGPRSRWVLSTPLLGRLLAGIFLCLKRQIIIRLKMGFHKIKPKLQRNWLREILRHAVLLQIFSVFGLRS